MLETFHRYGHDDWRWNFMRAWLDSLPPLEQEAEGE
jgi:hypothetical protein